jgi:hypothetical protein
MNKKLIVENNLSTLLPNGAYTNRLKEEIINSSKLDLEVEPITVFQDEITDDIVNVWACNVRDFLKLRENHKFDSLDHSSTVFMKTCVATGKDGVFINSQEEKLELLVVDKGTIQVYNSFTQRSYADILYYCLLYRKEYNEKLSVYLNSDLDRTTVQNLKKYITSIESIDFPKMESKNSDSYPSISLKTCE